MLFESIAYDLAIIDPGSSESMFYAGVAESYQSMDSAIVFFKDAFESGYTEKDILEIIPKDITNDARFQTLLKEYQMD